jgi:hypothetical protein
MAEQPPLNRSYVISYAGNDRDYPVIGLRLDPRVAGYRVPEDLSPHPDSKRYPNHVFTGSQPSNGDERVTHVYEILPAPWVPFTRYDDDLGPVQGRRRSVKNEGQEADLAADKKISYEGREGSAIVSNEIEETWSIKTDEDGNSLFPIKDRDFYDASRGAVQERRQLFVPTGEEVGSLENINGVITQTSYEPYNEFLSVKIVQTYKVDGPQLVGLATDNDGQLVTVTTQRKGSDGYVPPNPTATRTVEVNREDAESLVERIVDTPEIFTAKTFSVERPDPIPQKFRVAVPLETDQEIVIGNAEIPVLQDGDISRSEEQRNKFLKRVSSTSRDQTVLPQTLLQKSTDNDRQEVTITETLQVGNTNEVPTATKTVESEALGDGNYVIRKTEVPEVFAEKTFRKIKEDLTPQKFRGAQESEVFEQTVEGIANFPELASGEFEKSEQQINKFVKRISATTRSTEEEQELTESVLTSDGQIGVRRLTLSDGPQTIEQSELVVDASVEALGDGRTVKTEVKVPEVFDARVFSVEKPDITPAKFRVKIPVKTEQFTEKGTAAEPTLQDGDISKSEQQQTKYVKRVSVSSRDQTKLPSSLEQRATNEFKQVVNIKETLQNSETSVTPTATKTVESEALGDGNYIVRTSEVDDFFKAKSFSVESPDVVPAKFRSKTPTETTQEIVEGNAELPTLEEGDISKSEQQQDQFLKRTSTTTRDKTQLPASLSQKTTTNDGILATVTETLKSNDTSEQPSATKIVESEAIGDGLFVERITELAKIFEGKSFSVESPDVLPAKFRAKLKTTTEQKTIEKEGAEVPSLDDDEISKSEQEVTDFLVRETKVFRDIPEDVSLSQKITNENLQLATVTEKLQKTDTIEQPTATKTVESENLGDGNYIVRTVEVGELFDAKSFSSEKTDTIPAKFRAQVPTKTEQKNIAGQATIPNLSGNQISATNQQINDKVYREIIASRETSFPPLTQKVTTNERQLATVTEKIGNSDTNEQPSATKEVQSEALGDGKYLIRTTEVGEVFSEAITRVLKPDLTPEKFRAKNASTTKEFTEAGEVDENITLESGEFEKSEQQINKFVKRVSTTSREVETISSLEEKILISSGQLATRSLTLSKDEQEINPDALLIDGSIESLGDERTIKTEVRVDEIFAAEVFSINRPDPAPEKFRVDLPERTTQITVEGTAEEPALENDQISKSEQQQTKFTKRVITTSREEAEDGTLIGKRLGTWGKETVVESYNEDDDIELGYKILSNSKTPLGGGKFLGEKVTVEEPQRIEETRQDPETGITFKITKELVESNFQLPPYDPSFTGSHELSPIDPNNSVYIKTEVIDLPENEVFYTTTNFTFPDEMVSIDVIWEQSTEKSSEQGRTYNNDRIIEESLSWRANSQSGASKNFNA